MLLTTIATRRQAAVTFSHRSQMIAEQLVLGANGKALANGGVFSTACVRPMGILGAKDRYMMQRVLENRTLDIIADSKTDWVYVDNVVWCELLLERGLSSRRDEVHSSGCMH